MNILMFDWMKGRLQVRKTKMIALIQWALFCKKIKTMISLFSEDKIPTGDESEAFVSRLMTIPREMDDLRIHANHRPCVLYSILTDDSCKTCDDINLYETRQKDILYRIKKNILFDNEIKDRLMVWWSKVHLINSTHSLKVKRSH